MKVIEKINEDREAKIREVESEYELRITKIKEDYELKWNSTLRTEQEKHNYELVLALNRIRNGHLIKRDMDILREKQMLIDRYMERIVEDVISDPELYAGFIRHTAAAGAGLGMREILINMNDHDIFDETFIESLNSEARSFCEEWGGFYIGKERIDEKGIVIVNGRRRINGTVRAYVEEFRRNSIVEISEMLFRE